MASALNITVKWKRFTYCNTGNGVQGVSINDDD